MAEQMNRKLVLANGTVFYGQGFGSGKEAIAELVFNTSVVGYQEIVSDPSYTDQMIIMTYPLIGNYGITDEDFESKDLYLTALIVREYNDNPSNFRYTKTLGELLEEHDIPGISDIDTRRLTRIVRDEGSMPALLVDADYPDERAFERLKAYVEPTDQIARISCKKRWYSRTPNHRYNIVAIDCGIKFNIIKKFNSKGCNVTVVPYTITAEEIMMLHPDGLFLSNGPGDPANVPEVINLVKELRGKLPIFGICLGHQIIALACGATSLKMKFGHHGGNHPVVNLATGKIEITSQNHSYAVDKNSLEGTCLELTHTNLLDGTVEGLKSNKELMFSVQYHPESAPGPCDSDYLYQTFLDNIERWRNA